MTGIKPFFGKYPDELSSEMPQELFLEGGLRLSELEQLTVDEVARKIVKEHGGQCGKEYFCGEGYNVAGQKLAEKIKGKLIHYTIYPDEYPQFKTAVNVLENIRRELKENGKIKMPKSILRRDPVHF